MQPAKLKSELILFFGGLALGFCLAAAAAVGWASVVLAERAEVQP